ncbi:MAG: hypothetical protein JAY90_19655 [Candidatus Thiodiazotropha lotti]|nr:hypothetical protein [Candidatus Thiodiazotropha lotti]
MKLEKQTKKSIEWIRQNFPGLPSDYLSWMRDIGWGEHTNGYMIYSGPSPGETISTELEEMVVVADDMAGYQVGYIKIEGVWRFVGVDSCGWEIEELRETFTEYMDR